MSQTATEPFVMIGVEHAPAGTEVVRCGAWTDVGYRGEVFLLMVRPELPD